MPLTQGIILNNRYRIVKLLGQGGFGAVYRAWDINLNRACALKENLDASPEAQAQFGREALILANLNHPNLARVSDYFFIPDQGQYFVMDFVQGDDLQQMLDRAVSGLPETQVLQWIAQICDAVAYLHAQNPPIIHRDIKPANIKITPEGKAILVDFGIAKIYDPNLKTTVGARAVTPGFSPPEQYGQGKTDNRSDIYALGATLYTLLTGRTPPDSVDVMTGNAPPPLAAHYANRQVSEWVGSAVARAMALNRTERFASVGDFKNALSASPSPPRPAAIHTVYEFPSAVVSQTTAAPPAAVAAPPIAPAFTPPASRPLRRAVPWIPIIGALVLCAVCGGLYGLSRIPKATQVATPEWTKPVAAVSGIPPTTPSPEPTRTPTDTATPIPPTGTHTLTPLPVSRVIAPGNAADVIELERWGRGILLDVAWSPDGDLIAVATSLGIYVYAADSLGEELFINTGGYVYSVAFSPNGEQLASSGMNGDLRLWNARSGDLLQTYRGHESTVRMVAFSPDGRMLASGGSDSTVRLWDVSSGVLLQTLQRDGALRVVSFSADSSRVAGAGSSNYDIQIWDTASGQLVQTLAGHTTSVMGLSFSPDGSHLVSSGYDGVRLWDLRNGSQQATLLEGYTLSQITFSPDGSLIAGASDADVYLWNGYDGQFSVSFAGHQRPVRDVGFSPDGSQLTSAGMDGVLKVWEISSGQVLAARDDHSTYVYGLAVSLDGSQLFTNTYSPNTLQVLDPQTGQVSWSFDYTDYINDLALSPDGTKLATAASDLRLWDAKTGELLYTQELGSSQYVGCLDYSPDGMVVAASCADDKYVHYWNVETGQLIYSTEYEETIAALAFSPDGYTIAIALNNAKVYVWNWKARDPVTTLDILTYAVAFSTDGSQLVMADNNEVALPVWDTASWQMARTIKGLTNTISVLSFNRYGNLLVTADYDNNIILWNTETWEPLTTLTGHTSSISSLAFSPDGTRLFSGSYDGTIRIWGLP